MTGCSQERCRLTATSTGDRQLDDGRLFNNHRTGQWRGHRHAEVAWDRQPPTGGSSNACSWQAEKIVKEFHRPISS
jgi:hypothetical protein